MPREPPIAAHRIRIWLSVLVMTAIGAAFGGATGGIAGGVIGGIVCGAVGAALLWGLQEAPAEVDPEAEAEAETEAEAPRKDLVESDRIESLGVLAGGIAHDFNNLLTGILGNANVALTELGPGTTREAVQEIELAARRAHELVSQLLAYAGKGRLEVQAVNVGDLVREMAELLKRVIDPRANLVLHIPQAVALVEADPRQLRQIVMNLITNASDALGSAPGQIEVVVQVDSLGRAELDQTDLGRGLPTGDYVRLEVRDTGSGMDRETLEHIFDPFFTTKFTGRGLGLAALRGIVRHHMGAVQVQTEPGKGTTFRVWLPWAEQLDEDEDVPTEHGGNVASWKLRAGTVLLADDEDIVRRAATRMLSKLGFDVVATVDGEDAVRAFSEDPMEFTVVIMDVQMPGLDGVDALVRIRRIRPDVPAILCTAFKRSDVGSEVRPDAWLQKPFGIRDLVSTLDAALANHPGSTVDDEADQP